MIGDGCVIGSDSTDIWMVEMVLSPLQGGGHWTLRHMVTIHYPLCSPFGCPQSVNNFIYEFVVKIEKVATSKNAHILKICMKYI